MVLTGCTNGSEQCTDLFGDATIYTAEALVGSSAESGMGAGFVERFGESFATGVAKEDIVLVEGEISIGGIDLVIYPTEDGCDIAIPSINAIFKHMNGRNTHSIISSLDYIDSTIEKLQSYVVAGYDYVFTSHDLAESAEALVDKINYLKETKEIAQNSDSAEAFLAAMSEAFPNYDGVGYLEMSAATLFSE